MLTSNDIVLFQGDSITDAGRSRENTGPNTPESLGRGYAMLAAAALVDRHPGIRVFNRGISGHKVFQLLGRWQADCIDLKPTVVSILIGVNDIWHKMNGQYDGTVEVYATDYEKLLTQTRAALPEARIVLCEPFALRCGAVTDAWFPEFDERRAHVPRLAKQFGATFIPFHAMFEQATKQAPAPHWAGDGVHPSLAGHHHMAAAWLAAVDR